MVPSAAAKSCPSLQEMTGAGGVHLLEILLHSISLCRLHSLHVILSLGLAVWLLVQL